MRQTILKSWERGSKRVLTRSLAGVVAAQKRVLPPLSSVNNVLVLRLDQRIGNGILLLPLLGAIRERLPQASLHVLIHRPVAHLIASAAPQLVGRLWPYDQPRMMRRPWSYIGLARTLRKEQFDLVLCSNNPDSFSLSHAILGQSVQPGALVGFDAKEGRDYYDVAVASPNSKHYAEATLDLWRTVDPQARFEFPRLRPPESLKEKMRDRFAVKGKKGILVWLGATGSKVLDPEFYRRLAVELDDLAGDGNVTYAAGPADAGLIDRYPPFVKDNCVLLDTELAETAAFFSLFDLFISPDTGPMHLAVAVGCRTLNVFRGSSLVQYGYETFAGHRSIRWPSAPAGDGSPGHDLRDVLSGWLAG